MEKKLTQCPKCGMILQYQGHFCLHCGAPLQNEVKTPAVPENYIETVAPEAKETESHATLPLTEEDVKAAHCEAAEISLPSEEDGSAQPCAAEEGTVPPTVSPCLQNEEETDARFALGVKEKVPSAEDFKKSIFGNVAVLVLSLVFLLFAFAPVLFMRVAVTERYETNVSISIVDNVVFAIDSCRSLSAREIMDTDIYNDFYDSLSSAEHRSLRSLVMYGSLSDAQKTLLSKDWKSTFRIHLMNKNTAVDAGIFLSAVASLAYLAICLGVMIRAALQLIFVLRKKERRNFWYNIQYACLSPLFLPAVYFLMLLTYRFGNYGELAYFKGFSLRGDWGLFVTFFLALAVLIAVVVVRRTECRGKKAIRRLIRHAVLAAVALLMICVAFLPAVSIKMISESDSKELSFGMSDYSVRALENLEQSGFHQSQSNAQTIFNEMYYYNSIEDASSDAEDIASDIFGRIMLKGSPSAFHTLYLFLSVITIVFLILAAYLLWAALLGCAHEECDVSQYGKKRWIWIRVISIFMLALLLLLYSIAVFRLMVLSLIAYMDFSMGSGIILGLLTTVGACILLSRKKVAKTFDKDYDNADVSYSPYVLEDTK